MIDNKIQQCLCSAFLQGLSNEEQPQEVDPKGEINHERLESVIDPLKDHGVQWVWNKAPRPKSSSKWCDQARTQQIEAVLRRSGVGGPRTKERVRSWLFGYIGSRKSFFSDSRHQGNVGYLQKKLASNEPIHEYGLPSGLSGSKLHVLFDERKRTRKDQESQKPVSNARW